MTAARLRDMHLVRSNNKFKMLQVTLRTASPLSLTARTGVNSDDSAFIYQRET